MKTKLYIFLLLICFLGINPAQELTIKNDKNEIKDLKANLEFLASDELEGRRTTTNSARVAARFIATELEQYGVKPFGDRGTYFENFDLIESLKNDSSEVTFIDSSGSKQTFSFGDDFLFFRTEESFLNKIPLDIVFVGYGISAPEDNYNDYKNVNVKGKVVLLLTGKPEGINFTKKMPFYQFEAAKNKAARENGASAVIAVANNEKGFFIWDKIKEWVSEPSYELKDSVKKSEYIPTISLSKNGIAKFLKKERYDYDSLVNLVSQKDFKPIKLNQKIIFNLKVNITNKTARNVVGIAEGNDPHLKNEYVVLSAHYDHLGVRNGEIYNGADDNGSGTVAVLEAAKNIVKYGKNKRSILFVFHTGEEEGLLGSEYFTDNNPVIKNVIADINLDMVGRGSTDSIYSVGSGKISSEFKNLVEKVNSQTVDFVFNYKYDDPNDLERIFYRSDHYNYAKKGIPIVFFTEDGGGDYHKPTDDVEKINFDKILKVVKLVSHLAVEISNENHHFVLDVIN